MTVELFLALLLIFSTIASLVTEVIKNKFNGDGNISACIVSVITGLVGTLIYYQLNSISFVINNIIYAFLMSFATCLTSQVGYDKVKELIQKLI